MGLFKHLEFFSMKFFKKAEINTVTGQSYVAGIWEFKVSSLLNLIFPLDCKVIKGKNPIIGVLTLTYHQMWFQRVH